MREHIGMLFNASIIHIQSSWRITVSLEHQSYELARIDAFCKFARHNFLDWEQSNAPQKFPNYRQCIWPMLSRHIGIIEFICRFKICKSSS